MSTVSLATQSLDRATRRVRGVHYTPPAVVDFVLARALTKELILSASAQSLAIWDPSCGDGAFLLPALKRVSEVLAANGHSRSQAARRAGELVRGTDIDENAVAATNAKAQAFLNSQGCAVATIASVGDSLLAPPSHRCIAVIGNPPWGQKTFRFTDAQKKRLRLRYSLAKGVLDPCALFVELGLDCLASGGCLAFVLPDTVLLKNYRNLRERLLETTIDSIAHVGQVFPEANIDAITLITRQASPGTTHAVSLWHGLPALNDAPDLMRAQRFFETLPEKRFNIFACDTGVEVLRYLAAAPRFGELFEVREGVHTGNMRKQLLVDTPTDEKIVVGRKELARFKLEWAGRWLNRAAFEQRVRGKYATIGDRARFSAKKLLVRRTGDRVVCAADHVGYAATNNMFTCVPLTPDSGEALDAWAAFLNSRLMTGYFRLVQPRVGRLFAEMKINHLVSFPVPETATWQAAQAKLCKFSSQAPALDRLASEILALPEDLAAHLTALGD